MSMNWILIIILQTSAGSPIRFELRPSTLEECHRSSQLVEPLFPNSTLAVYCKQGINNGTRNNLQKQNENREALERYSRSNQHLQTNKY